MVGDLQRILRSAVLGKAMVGYPALRVDSRHPVVPPLCEYFVPADQSHLRHALRPKQCKNSQVLVPSIENLTLS